jgi:hypothetical protein
VEQLPDVIGSVADRLPSVNWSVVLVVDLDTTIEDLLDCGSRNPPQLRVLLFELHDIASKPCLGAVKGVDYLLCNIHLSTLSVEAF